ncbi:MAG: hypothetical protein KF729_07325 [Sandaracinaceae bacterium]|nr:hypothetical protein [Sandaracinaceae bacterium]
MIQWSRRAALHLALLLSGFAALVYEMSWTRMLHRVFGVGDLAVATVLAAFFLGLGLGSWAAARYAGRVRRPAYVYAVLEGIIAIYAAASPWLVPWTGAAYAAVGADASSATLSAVRLALALALLVPPTLLMGATLPVVALLVGGRAEWARGVTGLYAINTLGAMAGAGVAGLYAIPRAGATSTVYVAAIASLVAAALAVIAYGRVRVVGADDAPAAAPTPAQPEEEGAAPVHPALVASLALGTGLAALAAEVLWTRVLRTVMHATTQAFASMLVCYLTGIAVGALVGRWLARRTRPALALGATQALAAALIVVAMFAVPHLVRLLPLLAGELSFVPHRPTTMLLVAALLLLPLAIVSGTGLPLVWAMAEGRGDEPASGTGRLLAANTVGALIGSLGAGFLLVPWLGVDASLLLVALVHLVVAGLALRRGMLAQAPAVRAVALTLPLALGVGLLLTGPTVNLPFLLHVSNDPLRAMLEGPGPSWREPVVFLREGRASTVTVERMGNGLGLSNDGRPESGFRATDPGFGAEVGLLGGAAVLFPERTGRAMAIGLGGGHTTRLLLAGGFEQVDVVELEAAVVDAARMMHQARRVPFPLDDPRARLAIDDARNRLALAPAGTYDAIVSQPSHPWLAGSSALYTREFFAEARHALTDGGVLVVWINLFRIHLRQIRAVVRTLTDEFTHVSGFIAEGTSLVFVASSRPVRFDARLDARLARLSDTLRPLHLGARLDLLRTMELDSASARALGAGAPSIRDDRPLLEFELAATPQSARVAAPDLDHALREVPWWAGEGAWEGNGLAEALVRRVAATVSRPHALSRLAASLDGLGLDPAARAWVDGALAEARGDVTGALGAWDASREPRAALRADLLRTSQGWPRTALSRAAARATLPSEVAPLLRASLAVGEPDALRVAADLARRSGVASDRGLLDYVERELRGPCSALREAPAEVDALARDEDEVAFHAQGCAFAAGDREAARRLGTLAVRGRRAQAETAYEIGERCLRGGNGGCAALMLRRALRAYPGHSAAAAGLARTLHANRRSDEAREVLREALRHAEGVPASQNRLAATARELGLELGVALPPPPEDGEAHDPGESR